MGALKLIQTFPHLTSTLPMTPLGLFPTPVEEAPGLAEALGLTSLWVKRDDHSGTRYGGNKVRKLELLLGRAQRDHRPWVVTVGAWGSHHVLATSVYGRQLGVRVCAVMVPQPPTPHVLENLLATRNSGAEVVPLPAAALVAPVMVAEALRRRAMLIPPGGSSPLGALAYAGAALELAEQIRQGSCPRPERIYVALGSSGTLAGLVLGKSLAAELSQTEIIGVRVTAPLAANELTVATLATRAAWLLRSLAPEAPKRRFARSDIAVIHDQYGAGYGHGTPEGARAEALAAARAALLLDPTYTGKTMAGLIADTKRRPPTGSVMYWSTLSSADLAPLLEGASSMTLPRSLRALYRGR
jgi:1-aminocyclopropane-1-carboxylate deaminase/D-cysteine desulfhydrase-like pyridoxal-dependent ACC family enzyme